MKREIFIVHPHDIIRKGLNAILRSNFNVEVTQLENVRGMAAYSDIRNAHIIIFTGVPLMNDKPLLHSLSQNNQLQVVRVGFKDDPASFLPGADHAITLDSSQEKIRDLVSGLLSFRGSLSSEKEAGGDLTTREKEVLKLVSLGHSNKEIADMLFISVHTVISHRKNITQKLGIKSISGLTVYAILNGIIDPGQINMDQLI